MVRLLFKLAVAAAIVVSTWHAIETIAEHKADTLAGGDTFPLDERHPEEMTRFGALLDQLQAWQDPGLGAALVRVRRAGHLWIAPRLAGERSAIYVDSLGLARRIYVRRDRLVTTGLPFPELEVPEDAQRTYQSIRLAGTLYHELQHYEGLEDEAATYDRELAWYRDLRDRVQPGLTGEPKRRFEWAMDSALMSAATARQKATGASPP